jgi:sulfhydrogenase subunit gamma (sulfur reductase)
MSDWYVARVSHARAEAEGLTHLELDVSGTPLGAAYRNAGQYVKVRVDGAGESAFALASAPGERGRFELLVKPGPAVATALAALPPGAPVELSLPVGKGFPLEAARGKNVLLLATGSGISPIRAALQLIRAERAAYREVTLYFGARSPRAFAYGGELASWENDRVKVYRVVSQPGDSGWTGLTGHIQSHLGPQPPDTLAFVCGQKAMVAAVTEVLARNGVPKEQVFLNF